MENATEIWLNDFAILSPYFEESAGRKTPSNRLS